MRLDAALAAILGAVALTEVMLFGHDRALLAPMIIVMSSALTFRRRRPLASALLVYASFSAPLATAGVPMPSLGDPPNSYAAAAIVIVSTYSVGGDQNLKHAIAGLAAAIALNVGHVLGTQQATPPTVNDYLAAALIPTFVPWLAGSFVARQRRLRAVEKHADDMLLAAAEERTRIAREVHDLVAHSVSLMVVQAEAGEALLEVAPERTAESLRAVQDAGRQALAEMRATVAALRDGRSDQRGLAALPALLDTVRTAGLAVSVVATGAVTALPAAVDTVAYQVIREALTNALRHSDHSGVSVALTYHPNGVDVTIVDTGRPVRRRLPGGHGLDGLRERVHAVGGRLDAGPTAAGEHVTRVSLPTTA